MSTPVRRQSLQPFWRAAVLLLVFLLPASPAWALDPERLLTDYQHTAFTEREGAPARIHFIAQSQEGYLWLGGADGLYRFDGFNFEAVRSLGGEALPRQIATSFLQEKDGGIWLGFAGAGLMHYIGGHLIRYKTDSPVYVADAMTRGPDGTLWLLHNGRLAYLSGEHIVDVVAHDAWGLPTERAYKIRLDGQGTLWIATFTDHGVAFYLRKGSRRFVEAPALFQSEVLTTSADGSAWGCGDGGLRALTRSGAGLQVRPVFDERCTEMMVDSRGAFWMAVDSGLRHFGSAAALLTGGNGALKNSVAMGRTQGLTANEVTCMFEDRDGNAWIGTSLGLDRFSDTAFIPVPSEGRELGYAMANAGDGAIWFAKMGSLLGRTDGKTSREVPRDRLDTHSLSFILSASDGELFVAGSHIQRSFDGETFAELPSPGSDVVGSAVRAMTMDAEGALWVTGGEAGQVARFFKGRWTKPAGEHGFPKRWNSRAMLTDTQGRTWFSFLDQIVLLERGEARLLTRVANDLAVGWIMAIYEANGHLWVSGTDGVAWFDGQRFHTLKNDDGEPFALVCGIAETTTGELWLHGLDAAWRVPHSEVDQFIHSPNTTVRAQRFGTSDGLHGISTGADPRPNLIRGSDGRLWFSTSAGLTWLDPAKVSVVPRVPNVLIRRVLVDDRPFDLSDSNVLPARNRRLDIDYTAVSPGSAERIRFRYKLEGVDAGWHAADRLRQASYNDLPPGRYRFRVVSTDDQGMWNGKEAVFGFEVAPAWFQTSWFRLLVAVSVALALVVLYRMRVRRLAGAFRMAAQVQQAERERIARDLHDTLLQSVQSLVWRVHALVQRLPEQDPARSELDGMLESADRVIAEGREQVFGLRQPASEGLDLATALCKFGEDYSRDSGIAFHFQAEHRSRALREEVSASMLKILSEALSNAFHHSRGTNVTLNLCFGSKVLEARVLDDGQGIEPVLLRDGRMGHMGLAVMHERAESLGARLLIDSRIDGGTTVTMRLAAKRAYASTSRLARWHARLPGE